MITAPLPGAASPDELTDRQARLIIESAVVFSTLVVTVVARWMMPTLP